MSPFAVGLVNRSLGYARDDNRSKDYKKLRRLVGVFDCPDETVSRILYFEGLREKNYEVTIISLGPALLKSSCELPVVPLRIKLRGTLALAPERVYREPASPPAESRSRSQLPANHTGSLFTLRSESLRN